MLFLIIKSVHNVCIWLHASRRSWKRSLLPQLEDGCTLKHTQKNEHWFNKRDNDLSGQRLFRCAGGPLIWRCSRTDPVNPDGRKEKDKCSFWLLLSVGTSKHEHRQSRTSCSHIWNLCVCVSCVSVKSREKWSICSRVFAQWSACSVIM